MIALPKLRRMVRITHGSIEVEDSIKSSTRADPFIDCLTCRFSICVVIVGAFVRCHGSAEYLDPMLMGTFDELLQAHDEVFRAHHLVGKWCLFDRGAIQ